MSDELRETVSAAGAGDAQAFDSLFARNLPRLMAFVRARVGGVVAEKESVHDLVQSVCREAVEDLDRFDFRGEEAFRQWLFVRAVRKICNRYRWYQRARRDVGREKAADASEEGVEEFVTAFATISTPSRHASAREQMELFEAALEQLPDAQREAIAMTRVAGLSYAEAAEALGRTEAAVRGLVMRGLARLSALLESNEGGE